MDCNREEALRAKQIAEKKMENKDFSGALKIAIKAQQLYPQVENISQMILVCEVHCYAEKKVYGNEKDWYAILKIEPSADDLAIKKQYRKLALVLHPDKNKFYGSADAFKLIGEAQSVLLDREKRMIHDNKRKAFGNIPVPNRYPKQPSRQSNAHQHPWNQSNFTQGHSVNSQFQNNFTGGSVNFPFPKQWAHTGVGGNRPTFWTVCPFCSVRYQFYRDDVVNKTIHCQSCKKSFTAYELNVQGDVPDTNQSAQPTFFPQQNKVPFKSTEGRNRNCTSKPVFGGDNVQAKERLKPVVRGDVQAKERPKPVFGGDNVQAKERPKSQGNVNRKRKKKVEEYSECSDSGSSSESEEDVDNENSTRSDDNVAPKNGETHPSNQDFQYFGDKPRRSSRPKRDVSYKESLNDNDDDATPSNKAKRDSSSHPDEDTFWKAEVSKVEKEDDEKEFRMQVDGKKFQREEHCDLNADDKGEEASNDNMEDTEPDVFDCPDPEFSDFDKNRKKESFKAGQVWAIYDTEDAMPRFYAYIKKVVPSRVFKLQITWLEPLPGNKHETKWVEEGLPVSCGKFKRGKSDPAKDLPMFSHLALCDAQEKIFNIVPRMGETWALFRNWSIKWYSSTQNDTRKYEYDFVEILSDYDDDAGVRVLYLEKVKGFTCLFSRKDDGETVIPTSDKFRFSHMVPSCRMSGEEKEGVLKGSFELDPASLPASTFEQVIL